MALGREVEAWRQSQIRLDDHINTLRRQKFTSSNKQELLELLAAMELSVVVSGAFHCLTRIVTTTTFLVLQTKQNFRAISEQNNQK